MAEKSFSCPECERVFPTAGRLSAHRRMAPDHARPAMAKEPAKKTLDPDAILDLAVENLRNDGAILAATIAPHLGVAIHGVEGATKGEWIVKSRAIMAGNLLRERVRKEPRLVQMLMVFNRLHETPEGLVLAASIPAAIALDSGRMNPDSIIDLQLFGRPVQIQPMRLIVGDVIDYVKAESEAQGPAPGQNGAEPKAVPSEVAGGVTAT